MAERFGIVAGAYLLALLALVGLTAMSARGGRSPRPPELGPVPIRSRLTAALVHLAPTAVLVGLAGAQLSGVKFVDAVVNTSSHLMADKQWVAGIALALAAVGLLVVALVLPPVAAWMAARDGEPFLAAHARYAAGFNALFWSGVAAAMVATGGIGLLLMFVGGLLLPLLVGLGLLLADVVMALLTAARALLAREPGPPRPRPWTRPGDTGPAGPVLGTGRPGAPWSYGRPPA
jgi:hypothetical protein